MNEEENAAVVEEVTPAADPPTADATPEKDAPEDPVAAFKAAAEAVNEPPPKADPEPVKPAVEATPAGEVAPVEPDPKEAEKAAAADAEIAKINADLKSAGNKPLSKASEGRLRELAQRPKPEQVEAIVAPLRRQAERMAQWDDVVAQSTATGEEIQNALGVIQATKSGDPARELQAADAMLRVVQSIYQKNGKELPGLNDPLAGQADLLAAVENGTIERKYALELAQQRAGSARQTDTAQRTEQQKREFDDAAARAKANLNTIGAKLQAIDPVQYAAKFDKLLPKLTEIRDTMHPSQWEAATLLAYNEIPYAPVAPTPPPKPHVGAVPLRPTGNNSGMRVTVPTDPLAAFKMGAEGARG